MEDWKNAFTHLRDDADDRLWVDELVAFDWVKTRHVELTDDLDHIYELTPHGYCALLPFLLDALFGDLKNILNSPIFNLLLTLPKTRLEIWKNDQERRESAKQKMFDLALKNAAIAMGVGFDPEERVRHELLLPYDGGQRSILKTKIQQVLSDPKYHAGYEEHPLSFELEELYSMLEN